MNFFSEASNLRLSLVKIFRKIIPWLRIFFCFSDVQRFWHKTVLFTFSCECQINLDVLVLYKSQQFSPWYMSAFKFWMGGKLNTNTQYALITLLFEIVCHFPAEIWLLVLIDWKKNLIQTNVLSFYPLKVAFFQKVRFVF